MGGLDFVSILAWLLSVARIRSAVGFFWNWMAQSHDAGVGRKSGISSLVSGWVQLAGAVRGSDLSLFVNSLS